MKVQTNELTGHALDWAVARVSNPQWWDEGYMDDPLDALYMDDGTMYAPSTNWAQGGPIIEREGIDTLKDGAGWTALKTMTINHPHLRVYGPTPLIAAMRCYVASKLGDTIEVPEELLGSVNLC